MSDIITAFCYANGVVRFTSPKRQRVPDGALMICKGTRKWLRANLEPACRVAYDNKTLLVPGIPEADSQGEALTALIKFRNWVQQRGTRSTAKAKA